MFGYKKLVKKLEEENRDLRRRFDALCAMEALRPNIQKRAAAGEMDETELAAALGVPESNPLLRAVLQVMDGQREELLQDAAEQGIDPAESMARSRGADALRESADEIWQLVKQANAERVEDPRPQTAAQSG